MANFCNFCQVLLDKGAELVPDDDGWTPLHTAAASSDGTAIEKLVEKIKSEDHSLLEKKTNDGENTALHLAARNDKVPSR